MNGIIRPILVGTIGSLAILVAAGHVSAATPQAESFESAAAAESNGWTLANPPDDGNWGWKDSNFAGGEPGEARADSFTAGIQRWYADLDLDGDLSFDKDWQATGRMDFIANSASDGGMFFGFFDRNASLHDNTQTLAGFLLVNGELTLRFERRPNTTYVETSDFGLWVNDSRLFTLVYKANGAGPDIGRLTASLTRVADQTTITKSIDIPRELVVGATLNSFGFYAMDFAAGRATPFDWVVDDLTYGPPVPVAEDDTISTRIETSVEIDVLANDIGFPDPVIVGIFASPQHGSAVVSGSPGAAAGIRVRYTPNAGFFGSDSFTYAVQSGTAFDFATVSVSVRNDRDGDGIEEAADNCLAVMNPDQLDTDGDGFGNLCDGDLDNSGFVNFSDLALFRSQFGTTGPHADLDGSGFVNFTDLALFRGLFGKPPGPSGLNP